MNRPTTELANRWRPRGGWRVLTAWLTLCLIWSSTWLAIKFGLRDLPPISYAGLRFVVAVVALFAVSIGRVSLLPKSKGDFALIAFTGFLMFTVNYGLLFWGELHVSSGLAAVLQATIPISGMMFAHWMLPDKPMHPRKIAGGLIALAGVAVICARLFTFNGMLAFSAGLGILLGATCASFTQRVAKIARPSHRAFDAGGVANDLRHDSDACVRVCHGGQSAAFSLDTAGHRLPALFAIIGSSLTFLLLYWLLPRISSTKLNTIALITPPGAVALGWLFGGERLPVIALLGAFLVLLGVWMIFRRGQTAAPIRVEPEVAIAQR